MYGMPGQKLEKKNQKDTRTLPDMAGHILSFGPSGNFYK
jgi:hypothetical protein